MSDKRIAMPDTFLRIEKAARTGQPITLTAADVELLMEMVGDAMGEAHDRLQGAWATISDYHRTASREKRAW